MTSHKQNEGMLLFFFFFVGVLGYSTIQFHETPERLQSRGLVNVTKASIDIMLSRKWVKSQFHVELPFQGTHF